LSAGGGGSSTFQPVQVETVLGGVVGDGQDDRAWLVDPAMKCAS
jgi:hypothetical protein